jgi:hypothetical protein
VEWCSFVAHYVNQPNLNEGHPQLVNTLVISAKRTEVVCNNCPRFVAHFRIKVDNWSSNFVFKIGVTLQTVPDCSQHCKIIIVLHHVGIINSKALMSLYMSSNVVIVLEALKKHHRADSLN